MTYTIIIGTWNTFLWRIVIKFEYSRIHDNIIRTHTLYACEFTPVYAYVYGKVNTPRRRAVFSVFFAWRRRNDCVCSFNFASATGSRYVSRSHVTTYSRTRTTRAPQERNETDEKRCITLESLAFSRRSD